METGMLSAKPRVFEEEKQGKALASNDPALTSLVASRLLYIESYGCQMNFADSEIVASIMAGMGFGLTTNYKQADVIFINTCSIRENAEVRIRNRLKEFCAAKKHRPGLLIGVLGCMAERLKAQLLQQEALIDLVVGPDAYRDLPILIGQASLGRSAINVLLSREETYADVAPIRLNSNGVTAFVSITRGCDNMCSFCVVPFTRGRERSRKPGSIIREVANLVSRGYKEVTLLGQNVDSYEWKCDAVSDTEPVNFADLLAQVALISPKLRVRFSTSHPKDLSDEVLHTIAKYDNICNAIHLPVQSGSSSVLERMNRGYTREWYLQRIESIRKIVPGCAISTDIIAGFCGETEKDHQQTLSMMDYVVYHYAYMFTYSQRTGTLAAKKYDDDVPESIKSQRLNEIIAKQRIHILDRLQTEIGKVHEVLIEGFSKRSAADFSGRNEQNAMVVFPVKPGYAAGDYVKVLVLRCTAATLIGEIQTD